MSRSIEAVLLDLLLICIHEISAGKITYLRKLIEGTARDPRGSEGNGLLGAV